VTKFVATDYTISVGGVNFSPNLNSCTLDAKSEEQDTTSFGVDWKSRIGGLKDGSLSLDFQQDFGVASVDATLWPLLGLTVEMIISPTSAAVSATNPSYTFDVLVTEYQPFASSVGDLATLSVSWPVTGEIVRAEL